MADSIRIIHGGKIATPNGVVDNGTIVIENGVIAEILQGNKAGRGPQVTDAAGCWILPGMIDIHSDAIEHEMRPRPSSHFPIRSSFHELERKLVAQGITTIYHSFSMHDHDSANEVRRNANVTRYVEEIRSLNEQSRLIRNKIHIRFEITNRDAVPHIERYLQERTVDLLSFMDHTPGQGQYRDLEVHKRFIMQRQHKSEEEVLRMFEERKRKPKTGLDTLRRLAELARRAGVPLASHDDDSIEKLDLVQDWHAAISEFPVDLPVAVEAKRRGMFVAMGAPNVMLGRSHSNNLSALEAIQEGVVDILCSDYYPPAMLQSVFRLHRLGCGLHEAVNMVSLHPARALGIDGRFGSIEPGKAADLIMVRLQDEQPIIRQVWVEGNPACHMEYQRLAGACSVQESDRHAPDRWKEAAH